MHAVGNHGKYRTKFVNRIGGVEVNDGSVKWTVKTVTAKEYVDEKLNNYEKKQTVKTINVNVQGEYVSYLDCRQIGHVVQVTVTVIKADTQTNLIASGLPHALSDFIFNAPIHGDVGKSIRLKMSTSGELRFHYTGWYQSTQGSEFSTTFTYLTND